MNWHSIATHRYAIPMLFVLLWSTGFTMSKLGLPYSEPATFLTLRFFLAASILVLLLFLLKGSQVLEPMQYVHCAIVGLLLHATYLGGVFAAIHRGMDAGLAALIVSLQPPLTVLLGALFLGEALTRLKVAGTLLGLLGVTLVLVERGIGIEGVEIVGLVMCVAALFGISVGTIYQKKYVVNVPQIPSVCTQYIAAAAVLLPVAQMTETMHIEWTTTFVFALAWLVLILSLGAVFILMVMIRTGEVSRVASYIYLVPPFVAIEAYFMFDEKLTLVAILGIVLCIVGVAMVTRVMPKRNV